MSQFKRDKESGVVYDKLTGETLHKKCINSCGNYNFANFISPHKLSFINHDNMRKLFEKEIEKYWDHSNGKIMKVTGGMVQPEDIIVQSSDRDILVISAKPNPKNPNNIMITGTPYTTQDIIDFEYPKNMPIYIYNK